MKIKISSRGVLDRALQLLHVSKWDKLDTLLQKYDSKLRSYPDFYLLQSRVCTHTLRIEEAKAWIDDGLSVFPDNPLLTRESTVLLELERQLSRNQGEE